jgi:hypothetical protein
MIRMGHTFPPESVFCLDGCIEKCFEPAAKAGE